MASRKGKFFAIFSISLLSITLLAIAMGTQNWVEGEFKLNAISNDKNNINYGLFKGKHVSTTFITTVITLHMTCIYELQICAYSCRPTEELRLEELRQYYNGSKLKPTCDSQFEEDDAVTTNDNWLSVHLYISTIFFLSSAIFFATLSGMFSIYNSNRTPIQPIFGILGLYIWNGCSSFCSLLVLILWGAHYDTGITKDFSYMLTMFADSSITSSYPGYSYWLVLMSMVCHVISALLLIDRSEPTLATIPIQKTDDTIFLY